MEGLRNKASESGTDVNSETPGSYEKGKSVACKTWHDGPYISYKGGGIKGVIYTGTYVPRLDFQKKAKYKGEKL